MSESMEHQSAGETFRIRCIQALDRDPLFEGARYTFSVEGGGAGFELAVAISRYFVHLLTFDQRRGLEEIAVGAARRMLDDGLRQSATGRVSSDGVLSAGDRPIADLTAAG